MWPQREYLSRSGCGSCLNGRGSVNVRHSGHWMIEKPKFVFHMILSGRLTDMLFGVGCRRLVSMGVE